MMAAFHLLRRKVGRNFGGRMDFFYGTAWKSVLV
jgi:hypothetical protein